MLLSLFMTMVSPKNQKSVRKPRDVLIHSEVLHKARVETLRSKKTIGEWFEEAIGEKIERGKEAKIEKTCSNRSPRGV